MQQQRTRNRAALPVLLLVIATLVACTPEPASPRAARSSPDSSDGERESIDICALMPVDEVAEALGQEQAAGSAKLTTGQYATDCTYEFERDGATKYAIVWVYSVELWSPEARDDIEEIAGLGDAAYLTTSGFAQMHVLVDGVMYIDARADTPEEARRLAELALARLVERNTK